MDGALYSKRVTILFAFLGVATCPLSASAADCCSSNDCECNCSGPPTIFRWNACCPSNDDGDDALVTDRPDFTEASSTVGLGRAQLEIGYTYTFDDEAGTQVKSHSYPEPLLRVGMFRDWFEFRLAWNVAEETVRSGATSSRFDGAEDLQLGVKLALTEQCCRLPEMAVILQMDVPTGSSDFTADEVLPGINWVYSWSVTDCLSIAGSTQANRVIDVGGHGFTEFAQSMTAGLSLTEQLGFYTEWFALFPHSSTDPDETNRHFLNGGFTWLFNDDLQFDVRAGLGLNDEADDYFVGTGLSIRF